jgi:hypothetical protein
VFVMTYCKDNQPKYRKVKSADEAEQFARTRRIESYNLLKSDSAIVASQVKIEIPEDPCILFQGSLPLDYGASVSWVALFSHTFKVGSYSDKSRYSGHFGAFQRRPPKNVHGEVGKLDHVALAATHCESMIGLYRLGLLFNEMLPLSAERRYDTLSRIVKAVYPRELVDTKDRLDEQQERINRITEHARLLDSDYWGEMYDGQRRPR